MSQYQTVLTQLATALRKSKASGRGKHDGSNNSSNNNNMNLDPDDPFRGAEVMSVRAALDALESVARARGANVVELQHAMRLVLSDVMQAQQKAARRLWMCMIPHAPVPASLVVDVLGALGKLSSAARVDALTWVLVVYEHIVDKASLHAAYAVLFHYIEYETLRPLLCQLLFQLTRRHHVKKFRYSRVVRLCARFPDEPWLMALRELFEGYRPDLIDPQSLGAELPPLGRNRRPFPKLGVAWLKAQQAMELLMKHAAKKKQEEEEDDDEDGDVVMSASQPDAPFGLASQREADPAPASQGPTKRRRGVSRPLAEAAVVITRAEQNPRKKQRDEDGEVKRKERVSFREIGSVGELVDAVGRLGAPEQLSEVIDDAVLQHWLCLNPDPVAISRVKHWLEHALHSASQPPSGVRERKRGPGRRRGGQELETPEMRAQEAQARQRDAMARHQASLTQLMRRLSEMAENMQDLPVEVERWVLARLASWNGASVEDGSYGAYLLKLLTRVRCPKSVDLVAQIIFPLGSIFKTGTVDLKAAIVRCLGRLLSNWMRFDWKRHCDRATEHALRGSAGAVDDDEQSWHHFTFGEMDQNMVSDYFTSMKLLVERVDQMLLVGLVLEGDHVLLAHEALSFYETAVTLNDVHNRRRAEDRDMRTRSVSEFVEAAPRFAFTLPFPAIPSKSLAYRLFLNPSPAIISRLIGLLHAFRPILEDRKERIARDVELDFSQPDADVVVPYNTVIADVVHSLWTGRVWQQRHNPKANFELIDSLTQEEIDMLSAAHPEVAKSLSIAGHPAFVGLARKFDNERDPGVDLDARQHRNEFVRFLERAGFTGLYSFLSVIVRGLD